MPATMPYAPPPSLSRRASAWDSSDLLGRSDRISKRRRARRTGRSSRRLPGRIGTELRCDRMTSGNLAFASARVRRCSSRGTARVTSVVSPAKMADVEEVEVVVAHHERATLRVGDVFLKIDTDQTRTDIEVEAMAMAPVPTPE